MHAWALNVNGRSADEKEGKVRNFGRCPLPRQTRIHTHDFLSRSHEKKSNSSSHVSSFYCLIFSDIRPSYKSFPHLSRFGSFAWTFLVFNKRRCERLSIFYYVLLHTLYHLEYYILLTKEKIIGNFSYINAFFIYRLSIDNLLRL